MGGRNRRHRDGTREKKKITFCGRIKKSSAGHIWALVLLLLDFFSSFYDRSPCEVHKHRSRERDEYQLMRLWLPVSNVFFFHPCVGGRWPCPVVDLVRRGCMFFSFLFFFPATNKVRGGAPAHANLSFRSCHKHMTTCCSGSSFGSYYFYSPSVFTSMTYFGGFSERNLFGQGGGGQWALPWPSGPSPIRLHVVRPYHLSISSISSIKLWLHVAYMADLYCPLLPVMMSICLCVASTGQFFMS